MTICLAVCVHDGIVFAADSATSLTATDASGNSVISNVYNHGNKVFNLYKGLPVCAMTAGMGSIGNAPIHALSKDLRRRFRRDEGIRVDRNSYSIEEIVGKARGFFYEQRYLGLDPPPPPPHSFEYWVGGYSSEAETHELWRFAIINGECAHPERLCGAGGWGVFPGGQPQAIQRLLIGFDQALPDALLAAGISEGDLPHLLGMVQARSEVTLLHPAMPIQDAIDFAEFLVNVTKNFSRFSAGAGTVGGAIDIATVTRHERFKWIRRKHYYPASLNPLELDHDHGQEAG